MMKSSLPDSVIDDIWFNCSSGLLYYQMIIGDVADICAKLSLLGNMYYKGNIDYQSLAVTIKNVVYISPTLVLLEVINRMW